jgi:16S rRNA G966 N2-methylase RsmD
MILSNDYINIYTHAYQSKQILNIIKHYVDNTSTIVDANAGMGGNSLFFCKYFKFVYCLEINYKCIYYLEHNLFQYDNKEIYNIDCLEALKLIKYDCIFFDPPWGGNLYKYKSNLNLYINNIDILKIINSLYFVCNVIFLKAPLNYNINYNLLWKMQEFIIYKKTNYSFSKIKKIFKLIVFIK